MNPIDRDIVGGLPRTWTDRLFAALLTGQRSELWHAVAEIVLESCSADVIVVWETFDTTAFRRGPAGELEAVRDADAHALRAPAIYNAANLGFHGTVRTFDDAALDAAGLAAVPLVSRQRPLSACTADFLFGADIHATVAVYGSRAAQAARAATLEALRPALARCVASLFERRRAVAAGAGLANFLRDIPVGLILVDWFGLVLAANDEGYRQALVWNEAPRRTSLKRARQRFAVPDDLRQGWDRLRAGWIDWLRGEGAFPQALVIDNLAAPALKAVIELVPDHDAPTATPCFIVRFAGIHLRGADMQAPSAAQVAILSHLTPAERSVAMLVQAGLSNQEIADRLGRQIGTVKDHLTSIYAKLGISRRTQLLQLLHQG